MSQFIENCLIKQRLSKTTQLASISTHIFVHYQLMSYDSIMLSS